MPIFRCILDAEAIELHQTKRLCEKYGKVICVNTDCVYVQLFDDEESTAQDKADKLKAKAEKIMWHGSNTKKYNAMDYKLPNISIVNRTVKGSSEEYNYQHPQYTVEQDPGFTDYDGAKKYAKNMVDDLLNPKIDASKMISALAGTGKTFLTNCIIEELKKREIRFMAIAPTHVASHLLGKRTHSLEWRRGAF